MCAVLCAASYIVLASCIVSVRSYLGPCACTPWWDWCLFCHHRNALPSPHAWNVEMHHVLFYFVMRVWDSCWTVASCDCSCCVAITKVCGEDAHGHNCNMITTTTISTSHCVVWQCWWQRPEVKQKWISVGKADVDGQAIGAVSAISYTNKVV